MRHIAVTVAVVVLANFVYGAVGYVLWADRTDALIREFVLMTFENYRRDFCPDDVVKLKSGKEVCVIYLSSSQDLRGIR